MASLWQSQEERIAHGQGLGTDRTGPEATVRLLPNMHSRTQPVVYVGYKLDQGLGQSQECDISGAFPVSDVTTTSIGIKSPPREGANNPHHLYLPPSSPFHAPQPQAQVQGSDTPFTSYSPPIIIGPPAASAKGRSGRVKGSNDNKVNPL